MYHYYIGWTSGWQFVPVFITLNAEFQRDGRYFANDIFKYEFLKNNFDILFEMSRNIVIKDQNETETGPESPVIFRDIRGTTY